MGNLNPGNGTSAASQALNFASAEANNGYYSGVGTCLMWVRETFGFQTDPVSGNPPTAAEGWAQVPSGDKHAGDTNPPAGVPVYWTGGSSGAGHVAISAGGGNVYSTDFGQSGYLGDGRVHASSINAINTDKNLHYAGWAPYVGPSPISGAGQYGTVYNTPGTGETTVSGSAPTSGGDTSAASGSSFLSGVGGALASPFQDLFSALGNGLLRITYGLIGLVLVIMALHQAGK